MDLVKTKLDEKAEDKKKQLKNDLAIDDEDYQNNGENNTQEIIDEEELGYLQRMKELKKAYRETYEQLRTLRGEVNYIQQSIDTLKQ